MLALSDTAGVVLLVLGGIFVVAAGVGLILRSRAAGGERKPDIPPAMQPGPSDAALETPLLQKLQGWGLVLVAFFVVWIPISWLREPSANLAQERDLKTQAIARGAKAVQLFSEENQLGIGCVRCHGPELRGGLPVPIPGQLDKYGNQVYNLSANLTTVCGGPAFGHAQIKSINDIYTTIEQGRQAAGMPSWSIRFAGALDDQQINDLVNYLVWLSSKNVPFKDNVCVNPAAVAAATSPSASAAASPAAAGGS